MPKIVSISVNKGSQFSPIRVQIQILLIEVIKSTEVLTLSALRYSVL